VLFRSLHRETLTELLPLPRLADALDVAAGTGHVTELLASLGFIVTSVDLTEEMLTTARTRMREKGLMARFVLGNAFTLPFDDETFQIVVSTRFLHLWSIDQQDLLIREMARVLKRGGLLIVDFDNWWHRAILRIPIFIYQKVLGRGRVIEEYYNRVEQTTAMIEASGIALLDVRGVGGYFLVLPLVISRRLATKAGRLIGRTRLYRFFSEQFIIGGRKR
jgi:ubiquinone/menaquinone biosynthesis C-methylase UbiE